MPCTPAAKPALRRVSLPLSSGWVIVIVLSSGWVIVIVLSSGWVIVMYRFLAVIRVGHSDIQHCCCCQGGSWSLSCCQGGSVIVLLSGWVMVIVLLSGWVSVIVLLSGWVSHCPVVRVGHSDIQHCCCCQGGLWSFSCCEGGS